ncbi:ANTAR domain-containing protein [Streptomyces sp. NPDC086077]|uniref:ANTAR domain-containing protein n=1 Tax=Streptomyces sp. NPDC086077 TaxID=3154862 RepID=UPI0034266BE4
MAFSAASEPTPARGPQSEVERLRQENEQLRQALGSHAVIDRAIGVLTALGRIAPQDGFTVLREVSQHTNIKLIQVAEEVLKYAQGAALPDALLGELQAALARHRLSAWPDP